MNATVPSRDGRWAGLRGGPGSIRWCSSGVASVGLHAGRRDARPRGADITGGGDRLPAKNSEIVRRADRSIRATDDDDETTIRELKDLVLRFSRERDWEQFHHPKDLGLCLAIEAGEALEHFRFRTNDEARAALADPSESRPWPTSWPIASGPCSGWPMSAGSICRRRSTRRSRWPPRSTRPTAPPAGPTSTPPIRGRPVQETDPDGRDAL